MSGRSKGDLVLSDSEREDLQSLTKRRKTAQALALRARVVLAGHTENGFEVAVAVRDPSCGRPARCTR